MKTVRIPAGTTIPEIAHLVSEAQGDAAVVALMDYTNGPRTVAALAGGWIFLRNPALATMVAAAFTEKTTGRRR
jgi:hypothetical protein